MWPASAWSNRAGGGRPPPELGTLLWSWARVSGPRPLAQPSGDGHPPPELGAGLRTAPAGAALRRRAPASRVGRGFPDRARRHSPPELGTLLWSWARVSGPRPPAQPSGDGHLPQSWARVSGPRPPAPPSREGAPAPNSRDGRALLRTSRVSRSRAQEPTRLQGVERHNACGPGPGQSRGTRARSQPGASGCVCRHRSGASRGQVTRTTGSGDPG